MSLDASTAEARKRKWYWRLLRFPLTRILIGTPLVFVGGYVPVGFLMTLFGVEVEAATGTQMIVSALCAVLGATLAYWFLARFIEWRSLSDLRLRDAPQELALGAVLGVGGMSLIVGLIALFGGYRITGVNPASVLVYALGLAVVSGFVEEIVMRGLFYRIVEEWLGTWSATALSALLFGLLYALNDISTLAGSISVAIWAGPVLAGIYVLTRRLWMCIGYHIAWNFLLVGVYGAARANNPAKGLLASDRGGSELINGGDFGAEGSVIAIAVGLAATVVLYVVVTRRGGVIPYRRRTRAVSRSIDSPGA